MAQGALLGFNRVAGGERLNCWFNLGLEPVALPDVQGEVLLAVNGGSAGLLPGYGAVILRE